MRKVLIGTPSHDGRVDAWYANSLVNTVRIAPQKDTVIVPIFMAYDSLVQRARNDLVRLALEEEFDDLIFIDSDPGMGPRVGFQSVGSRRTGCWWYGSQEVRHGGLQC